MNQSHDPTARIAAEEYARGFADGLAAQRSLVSHDLQVLSLANALDAIALHVGLVGELAHERCVACETAKVLARVVVQGRDLLTAERAK